MEKIMFNIYCYINSYFNIDKLNIIAYRMLQFII